MYIRNLPVITEEQQNSIDFIIGVFESHHVTDTIQLCSYHIARLIIDELVPYILKNSSDNELINALGNRYIFTQYEYIPVDVCEQIVQENPRQYINTFSYE